MENLSKQFRVNSDSDGCVYHYTGSLFDKASVHFAREEPWPEQRSWDMAASMGIQSDTFWDFFHQATADGLFLTGEPISGSIPVLKRLAKKYRVRIITHKHLRIASSTAHAMRDTISFYEGHGLLQNVELIFPQSVFHKQGFPAEVVIDDKPDLGWAQDGAVNILFDQPWNEEVELQEGMVRAYDWSEVETIVNTTYADWKQMRGQVDRALSEARN